MLCGVHKCAAGTQSLWAAYLQRLCSRAQISDLHCDCEGVKRKRSELASKMERQQTMDGRVKKRRSKVSELFDF